MTHLHLVLSKKKRIKFQVSEWQGKIAMELEEECTLPWEPELKLDTITNVFLVAHKFSYIR